MPDVGMTTIATTTDATNSTWQNSVYTADARTHLASAGDRVKKLWVYGSGSGQCELGVYVISGGVPGARVGNAEPVTIGATAAWHSVDVDIALTAGTRYGIAIRYFVTDSWDARWQSGSQMTFGPATAQPLPSTWTGSTGADTAITSIYMTVQTAFASVEAVNGEVGTSLGAANAIPAPAGVVSGDLLVAWGTSDNPSTTNITASTGWTQINTQVQGSNVIKHTIFARIADGGANDALALSGAAQDYCATIARIANHGVTNVATDIKVATAATGSTGNADPPSLDAGSVKDWLWLASAAVDFTTGNTISADPTNYTNVDNRTSASSTSSCGHRIARRALNGQTENPGAFTNTSRPWIGAIIAIPPPSTGSNVNGTAAADFGGLTATAVGTPTHLGVAAASLGGVTATATGQREVLGNVSLALGGLGATIVGVRTVLGTGDASLGGLTAHAAGTTPLVNGTATADLGALTATAVGAVDRFGTAAAALGGLTATVQGRREVSGSLSVALGGLSATATGVKTVTANGAASLGSLGAVALGQRTVLGQAVAALGGLTAHGSDGGVANVQGQAVAALGGLTATATGVRLMTGQAAATLGGLGAVATGNRGIVATAASSFGGLGAQALGTRAVLALATADLGGLAAAAAAARVVLGVALADLGGLVAHGTTIPTKPSPVRTFPVAVGNRRVDAGPGGRIIPVESRRIVGA